jgi:ATP/maltotriose-dependent transcriptional regulator MalT
MPSHDPVPVAAPDLTEPRHRVGESDVDRLAARTREQRAVDYRTGGGSCVPEVLRIVRHATRMLRLATTDTTAKHLRVAAADIHNLAGWVHFDTGMTGRAQVYFSQALVLAGEAGDNNLVANIFYRLGRVRLHKEDPTGALDYFDMGQSADPSDGGLAASILTINQAWAHAAAGAARPAVVLMEQAVGQFGEADRINPPDWARFFTETDMLAMTGAIRTELARRVDPKHADAAVTALTEATDGYRNDMARSRTFGLLMLAESHLVAGEVDRAVDAGLQALASAENISSARIHDRIRLLRERAELHNGHSGAQELAMRIAAFGSSPNS